MREDLFKNATFTIVDKSTNEVVCEWDGSISNLDISNTNIHNTQDNINEKQYRMEWSGSDEVSIYVKPNALKQMLKSLFGDLGIKTYKHIIRMKRTNALYQKRMKKYG